VRPNLLEQLHQAITKHPFTLISAPAGSGKTTLVALWGSKVMVNVRGPKPTYQLQADELRRVHTSVQFIWGDSDPFGGLDVAQQAIGVVPDARLHTISGGHLPWWDDADECAHIIREYLTDVAG
jgi:pimeloyl-ACP methyl ester carboxylesterase